MKNIFLKLIMAVSVVFWMSSCGPSSCTQGEGNEGGDTEIVMKAVTDTLTRAQLDSLCAADELSNDLNDWMTTTFVDYESNMRVTKHVWVNAVSEDEEVTYIIVPTDTLYDFTKRTINPEAVEEEE